MEWRKRGRSLDMRAWRSGEEKKKGKKKEKIKRKRKTWQTKNYCFESWVWFAQEVIKKVFSRHLKTNLELKKSKFRS